MSTTCLKFAPIAVCLALGLVACGDDKKSSDTTAATTAATATTVATTETSATDAPTTSIEDSGGGFDVMLADSSLGQILVDGDGYTLYRFTNDGLLQPTCTGGCASTWPPLLIDDELLVGPGVDIALFSAVTSENGPQWSYLAGPLYRYSGDSAPGDTNGQGVGGVWFAVDANGDLVT